MVEKSQERGLCNIHSMANIMKVKNELKLSHEPVSLFPCHSVTLDLLPTIDTDLDIHSTIKGRAHIKTEPEAAIGEGGGHVVDDAVHFFACPCVVGNPIMSVEWRLNAVQSEFRDQEMDDRQVEGSNCN